MASHSKQQQRRVWALWAAVVLVSAAMYTAPLAPQAEAACANHCGGHGDCDTEHLVKCSCYDGFDGADCTLRLCPTGRSWADEATGVDVAHARHQPCSDRGTCDYATGTCKCQAGFEGRACQRMTCWNGCSGHGVCRSMRRAAEMLYTSTEQYKYSDVWDADMIHGCDCDIGWEGADCSLRTCIRSDDHMTQYISGSTTVEQETEVQLMLCDADGGWFTLQLDGRVSQRIYTTYNEIQVKDALEPSMTAVEIVFLSGESTVCVDGGAVTSITFVKRTGDVPPVKLKRDYLNQLTHSGGTASVVIRDGTTTSNDLVHNLVTYTARQGTKEYDYCANRGFCDQQKGDCLCYPGYSTSNLYGEVGESGDCGHSITPITSCPGEIECSGHGNCADHPTYRCECEEGWQGGDCSERTCPFDRAWFDHPSASNVAHADAECSNRGLCDRATGECVCSPGFTGTACERMVCPGENNACSGHGRCMSMAQLAEVANVNGDSALFTYGAQPEDTSHWDFNKVYGCHCDAGWHGYDCSLRDCPRGDDPKTDGEAERQLIKCTATAGTFQLSFRQSLTDYLSYDSTAADLKAALEGLDTVAEVTIDYSNAADDTAPLCDVTGDTIAQITFTQNFGDLPNLILEDGDNLTPDANAFSVGQASETDIAMTVYNAITGTKENNYCSDRGICNEKTGLCKCFTQYGSSNGWAEAGMRGDCGFVLPVIPVDKAARELHLFLAKEEQFGAEDVADLNF